MAFEQFPYTNFHDLNLDWVLKEVKRVSEAVDKWSTEVLDAAKAYTDEKIATVAQVDANTNLVISPSANSFDAAVEAQIRATTQAQNQVTFYATSIPEQSVYMNIINLG